MIIVCGVKNPNSEVMDMEVHDASFYAACRYHYRITEAATPYGKYYNISRS